MRYLAIALCCLGLCLANSALAQPRGCPPGLAKKNPPCIPPGQANKYRIGDRVGDEMDRIGRPDRYRLPDVGTAEGYYRDGRIVYRVDETTRKVIDWIQLTDDLLGG